MRSFLQLDNLMFTIPPILPSYPTYTTALVRFYRKMVQRSDNCSPAVVGLVLSAIHIRCLVVSVCLMYMRIGELIWFWELRAGHSTSHIMKHFSAPVVYSHMITVNTTPLDISTANQDIQSRKTRCAAKIRAGQDDLFSHTWIVIATRLGQSPISCCC